MIEENSQISHKKSWWENGRLEMQVAYNITGLHVGEWKYWHENGEIHGESNQWHENG